eukprot:jgi/Psemu1/292922/fgenesh1_pg.1444_\
MEHVISASGSPVISRHRIKKQTQDSQEVPQLYLGNGEKHHAKTKNPYRGYHRNRYDVGKKGRVAILIVFFFVLAWICVLRFEYLLLRNMSHSIKGSEIGTFSLLHKSNTDNNSSEGLFGRSPKARSGYDSIFCRARSREVYASMNNDNRHKSNQSNNSKPVFLWGIPSTSSEYEIGRRKLLRETYLDFDNLKRTYLVEHRPENATSTTNHSYYDDRICSFHDFICDEQIQAKCQMVYVFFVAGHKNDTQNVPPLLLNESITDFRDMLLPYNRDNTSTLSVPNPDLREPGTVYFNIRENQFDGKMTTWFKFASLVAKEYNSRASVSRTIDYIFKVDSDLLLLTPHFFDWFDGVHKEQQKLVEEQTMNSHPRSTGEGIRRVYGGIEFPATNCVVNHTFDHACPLPLSGPSYMSGELNFCSVDLATYISSDDCPREQWTIPHEDVSLSNYIYSYQNNTAYHREIGIQYNRDKVVEHQHINIVSVNKSRVLLLPNMKADWTAVSFRKNPELLRNREILWGHSIARGNYTMYRYWKKDSKFTIFWKFFFKNHVSPYGGISTARKRSWSRVNPNLALQKQFADRFNMRNAKANERLSASVANVPKKPSNIKLKQKLRQKQKQKQPK